MLMRWTGWRTASLVADGDMSKFGITENKNSNTSFDKQAAGQA
jgi:hypothetical protein